MCGLSPLEFNDLTFPMFSALMSTTKKGKKVALSYEQVKAHVNAVRKNAVHQS